MATNNSWNSQDPAQVSKGGTGATTLTDHGVLLGSGTGAITPTAAPSNNSVLAGIDSSDPAFTNSIASTGAGVQNFDFTTAVAASTRSLRCLNTDATAATDSSARVLINTQSASIGDPYVSFVVSGGSTFVMGIDNSDSDTLKIRDTSPSAGSLFWNMTTAGERTMPLQPAFLATQTTTQTDVTGDGTAVTFIPDTEIFDQNGDYNNATGVFTAPVSGRYEFQASVFTDDWTALYTQINIYFNGSNRDLVIVYCNPINIYIASNTLIGVNGACLLDMDSGDTCVVTVIGVGSTKTIDIVGGLSPASFFSGKLAC